MASESGEAVSNFDGPDGDAGREMLMISLGNAHHECSEAKRALAASQADLAALRQVAALLFFSRVVSGVWSDGSVLCLASLPSLLQTSVLPLRCISFLSFWCRDSSLLSFCQEVDKGTKIAHASLDAASSAASSVVDSDTRKELEALLAESNAALAAIEERTQQVPFYGF